MRSDGCLHLSEEQLARYEDGEPTQREADHLNSCPSCQNRLEDLRVAAAAYIEYRSSTRDRLPAAPPQSWAPLNALIAKQESRQSPSISRWWAIPALAACCGLLFFAVLMYQKSHQSSAEANELLSHAARVERPGSGLISVRLHGRTVVRPAVLTGETTGKRDSDVERIERLFVVANYSWREPLSVRSYQSWRNGLKKRRDTVRVIQVDGQEQSFRVQTDTSGGILRSASLTLRRTDLRPTSGAFQFEGEERVELASTVVPAGEKPRSPPPVRTVLPIEVMASPEDTLHVLAALNTIGADVGEPVEVAEDSEHHRVVVRASGISADRQQQIAAALKALPRVSLAFDARTPDSPRAQQPASEKYSSRIPPPLLQQFEDRFGGSIQFQQTTDRVLENSASLVARAHAVQTLASKFPPQTEGRLSKEDRQLLSSLQGSHLAELARLLVDIRAELKPILTSSGDASSQVPKRTGAAQAWQDGIPALVSSAQQIDTVLNRVLAGSYSQRSGEEMLRELTADIEVLNGALQSQPRGGK